MIKIYLTLLIIFVFNGFLNAQDIGSKKCDCDSIVKTKIESRVMFAFAGRTVKSLVKPEKNTCEIGTFSFDILVNRNGKIIQAVFNTKISSTISDSLKTILLDAAIKSQFMDDDGAPSKQKGNITYVFRLKNEN